MVETMKSRYVGIAVSGFKTGCKQRISFVDEGFGLWSLLLIAPLRLNPKPKVLHTESHTS